MELSVTVHKLFRKNSLVPRPMGVVRYYRAKVMKDKKKRGNSNVRI